MKNFLWVLIFLIPPTLHAQKLKPVPAEYPALALKEGIAGVVHLNIKVSKEGRIQSVQVADGPAVLVNSAKENAEKWQIAPSNATHSMVLTYVFVIDQRFESVRMEFDSEQKIVTITQKRPVAQK